MPGEGARGARHADVVHRRRRARACTGARDDHERRRQRLGVDERPLGPALYAGVAAASIGGPIALLTLLPAADEGAAGGAGGAAGLVVLLALVVFTAPLAIWLAFSRDVVSRGGLSAFVAAAAGRRAAVAHGWVWALAYFLYLPYTVTFVVYDLLPPVFPGVAPYRTALELVLPAALVLVALAPLRPVAATLALLAAAQLAGLVALAVVELRHSPASLAASGGADVARGTGNTALLFVCASLPLYLGAETRGGSPIVRRGLLAAFGVVGAAFLAAALPLGHVPEPLRDGAVPGYAIASAYGGRAFGAAVGVLTALSALVLIVAEYLALARLLNWLHRVPVRTATAWIAVPFVALDALSLLGPDRFYDDLLRPSLGALFLSQLVVFAVFVRFRPRPWAAAVASGLAVWGLYTLVAGGAST